MAVLPSPPPSLQLSTFSTSVARNWKRAPNFVAKRYKKPVGDEVRLGWRGGGGWWGRLDGGGGLHGGHGRHGDWLLWLAAGVACNVAPSLQRLAQWLCR
jgi:hypothetical protein